VSGAVSFMAGMSVHIFGELRVGVTTLKIDFRGVGGTIPPRSWWPVQACSTWISRVSGFGVRACWRFEGMENVLLFHLDVATSMLISGNQSPLKNQADIQPMTPRAELL
jgi:hypothetical protein